MTPVRSVAQMCRPLQLFTNDRNSDGCLHRQFGGEKERVAADARLSDDAATVLRLDCLLAATELAGARVIKRRVAVRILSCPAHF